MSPEKRPTRLEAAPDELLISQENLLFLGFSETDYGNISIYAGAPTPRERIDQLLEFTPGAKEDRARMLWCVRELDRRLGQLPQDVEDIDVVLREIIKQIAIENASSLDEPTRKNTLIFIDNLDKKPGELFLHLDEAKRSTIAIAQGFSNHLIGHRGRLLTERQLLLMEFTAATHDLPKLMGSFIAQIDPDHEVIYKKIIGKHLAGKSFRASNGQKIILSDQDVDFCTGLVGFHEDIWRERTFSQQVDSLKTNFDPANPAYQELTIQRARMIFHFIDIFGDALVFGENGLLTVKDDIAFENRFVDLFRRHLNLPIIGRPDIKAENWTRGKVFRPEWGLHGVAGLTWTFAELRSGWGIGINDDLISKVQQGILRVLQEADSAASDILTANLHTNYKLSYKNDDQIPELLDTILYRQIQIQEAKQKLLVEIGSKP